MVGVTNDCPGCGERCWDMEPCNKCGTTGEEMARASWRKIEERKALKTETSLKSTEAASTAVVESAFEERNARFDQ